MRALQLIRTVALGALTATVSVAATPTVGQEAPEFGSADWVLNAPEETSIAALKGEVVFVEKWGVKCPPCVALIPHVEKLQQTYGARGLHIFAFEAQNHSADEIRAKIAERGGKTYPVSAGGGNGYQGDGSIPVAWLIGVDGTVIWQGNPAAETAKLDRMIEEEVAKVRYPGMGRSEFHPEALKSVKAFMKQDLAGARDEARKLLANEKLSDAHGDA
ncbi:MAG: redoxin family protein, partial [Planctomycetes bacterium]|nr:redoxin family protein [Planctomycetota bacterium]